MSTKGYLIRDQQAIHFVTCTVVEWVDVFTRSVYADIVVDSLKFCQIHKGLRIHAWCIMSNHVHLIISTGGKYRLSEIIRDFKKFTSNQIIQAIKNNEMESRKKWMLWIFSSAGKWNKRNELYQFWRQENHPVECSTVDILESRLKYLHENPLKSGLVRDEASYSYSSAIDYYRGGKGLIDIDFV